MERAPAVQQVEGRRSNQLPLVLHRWEGFLPAPRLFVG